MFVLLGDGVRSSTGGGGGGSGGEGGEFCCDAGTSEACGVTLGGRADIMMLPSGLKPTGRPGWGALCLTMELPLVTVVLVADELPLVTPLLVVTGLFSDTLDEDWVFTTD